MSVGSNSPFGIVQYIHTRTADHWWLIFVLMVFQQLAGFCVQVESHCYSMTKETSSRIPKVLEFQQQLLSPRVSAVE